MKNSVIFAIILVLLQTFNNYKLCCQVINFDNQVFITIRDMKDSSKLPFALVKYYKQDRTIKNVNASIDGVLVFSLDSVAFVEINYAAVYPIFLMTSYLEKENVVYMITCDELYKTGYVKHDRNMIKLAKMINRFSEKWLNNKKNMDKDFRKIDDFYNNRIGKSITK